MTDEFLLKNFDAVELMPPCGRGIPSSIRGIPMPRDYAAFLARHDGARLVYDRSKPDLDDVAHIKLFSLNDIATGARDRDVYGRYLGSEESMREDFQNPWLEVRTTANDVPYGEAPDRYAEFYRDHLVIGYVWGDFDAPIRWIALFGVDGDGAFIMSRDRLIEHRLPPEYRGGSLQMLLEQARKA